MKKIPILLIALMVIIIGFLSGCNEQSDTNQEIYHEYEVVGMLKDNNISIFNISQILDFIVDSLNAKGNIAYITYENANHFKDDMWDVSIDIFTGEGYKRYSWKYDIETDAETPLNDGAKSLYSPFSVGCPTLLNAVPYFSVIVTNDVELRTYANSIIKDCPWNDKECQINEIYRHIVENFNYVSDPRGIEYIQSPQETLQIGGGDCEDLSILFNSLCENIGIKTYLVLNETHAYSLVYDVDIDNLFPYVEQSLIKQVEEDWGEKIRQTLDKSFVLEGYGVWYYGGDGTLVEDLDMDWLNISYTIESSRPLDLYVVPSEEDYHDFAEGKSYNHYPDCQDENILSLTSMCSYLGDYGGIVLFNDNSGDATVDVEIEFYFYPSFYRWFDNGTVTYYEIDDKECIVVDCTVGVTGYAGYDGGISGEKFAIDPITYEYEFLE